MESATTARRCFLFSIWIGYQLRTWLSSKWTEELLPNAHESECQAIRSLVFAEDTTSPKNRDLIAEYPEEPMPTQPIIPDKPCLAQHLGTGSPRSLLTSSIWIRTTPRGTGQGCRLTHLRTGGSIAQPRLVATTRSLRQLLGLRTRINSGLPKPTDTPRQTPPRRVLPAINSVRNP